MAGDESPVAVLSFAGVSLRARTVAARLQKAGAAGQRVLLLYPPGLELITAFWGCLAAGAVAVPANVPRLKTGATGLARLLAIVEDASPAVVLTDSSLAERFAPLPEEAAGLAPLEWIHTDRLDPELAADWRRPALEPQSLAFLQYTSGSTAAPKGVMVSHGNLLYNLAYLKRGFELSAESRSVSWLPLFHDMGLIDGVLAPFYCGYTAHLMSPLTFLQRPVRWLEAISRLRATHSGAPNFAYELCLRRITPEQREGLDLSSWNSAYCGAEPVRQETMRRFAATFAPCGFRPRTLIPGYGLAEATLMVSGSRLDPRTSFLDLDRDALERGQVAEHPVETPQGSPRSTASLVSCGRLAMQTEVAIVHPETRERCAEREIGEIWVAGPTVAQGYWGRPEETEEIFRARIAASGEGPFLRTGDLGFLADGRLFITSRLKDLIILRGRNHHPQDIEATVAASHPLLRPDRCAAFAVEEGAEEHLVIAQEVTRHWKKLDLEEVCGTLRQAVVERHEVEPRVVLLLKPGGVLKTSSGKIQRRACRAAFLAGRLPVIHEWRRPRGEMGEVAPPTVPSSRSPRAISRWLALWLARFQGLEPDEVDLRGSFARCGVDSMAAVNLVGQLGEWLGEALPPTLLYEHPTPEELARHLSGAPSSGEVGTSPGERPSEATVRGPRATEEPVAIVGIGCRFPGADGPEAFWRLLRDGVDAVRELPPERWGRRGPAPRGGFLASVDRFDPALFDLVPREVERMDPQQRLLLEVAWEALEDANLAAEGLRGSDTGVFVGISTGDYGRLQSPATVADDAFAGTGTAFSIAANRISFLLDLHGPSVAVDTACSSSLVALHLACRSLGDGDASLALVGGVNLILAAEVTEVFVRAGLIAPDGRCRAFDAGAEGYVRGEGAGMVVLKPLSRALADGDRIYAVVRGTAVNQDGRTNGLTAPSRQAQEAVLRRALSRAGVAPGWVSYVEAHGSGTPLGDPIEAAALGTVLAEGRPPGHRCAIGSVKTNLGHLEAAAGIAGLIKTALSLAHGELPASLHFETPNPHIPLEELPLAVQSRLAPLSPPPGSPEPVLAGVSSFGFGGTNAHAVLAAPPERAGQADREVESHRPWQLLLLSAASPGALEGATARLANHLETHPGQRLADVAHTLRVGRTALEHRRMLVCDGREEAITALIAGDPARRPTARERGHGREVAFLLPGVGDQYAGMTRGLYQAEPLFRREIDRAAEILRPLLGEDLRRLLYPEDGGRPSPGTGGAPALDFRRMLGRGGAPDGASRRLTRTAVAHPAVFAIEIALARLWREWGVRPAAMLGYSVGEYAAACLAGVFSFEQGLGLVAKRAVMIEELTPGAMLAVPLAEAELARWLEEEAPEVDLAAVNGPELCVVSGPPEAVEALSDRLAESGVGARPLSAAHAFHGRAMAALAEPVADLLSAVSLSPPTIPYLSNATGTWITPQEATDPRYWVRQMCRPVRFAEGLAELTREEPERVLLEIGPGSLSSLARQGGGTGGREILAVPSLRHDYDPQPDAAVLLAALGRLWLAGVEIDWQGFEAGEGELCRVPLPTYAFDRQRYWMETARSDSASPVSASMVASDGRAAAPGAKKEEIADWFYLPTWKRTLPARMPSSPPGRRWLLFADAGGLGEAVAGRLAGLGHQVTVVTAGDGFERLPPGPYAGRYRVAPGSTADHRRLLAELEVPPEAVAQLWSVFTHDGAEPRPRLFERAQQLGYLSLLAFTQALAARNVTDPISVTVVASGLHRVDGTEDLVPEKATLAGISRVMAQEYLHLSCRTVDLHLPEVADPRMRVAELLAAELVAGAPELDVALRSGDRWVLSFEPVRVSAEGEPRLRAGGVYLVTGGFGAVGAVLAEHLAREHGARLALLGRSALPAEAEWNHLGEGHPASGKVRLVRHLEALGAQVLALSADVADATALAAAVGRTRERFGALHGVFHAAGVLDEGTLRPLQDLDLEASAAQFRPKVQGVYALEQALAGVEELDFCLLMSSLTSILGGLQLAAYAAANAFLDAWAVRQHRLSQVPWLSMGSDLWDLKGERYAGFGATVLGYRMSREEGIEVVRRLLAAPPVPHLLISTGDLSERIRQWLEVKRERGVEAGRRRSTPARRRRLATPYEPPTSDLERTIVELWQELLGIEQIGVHDHFFELGGHSLLATRFTSRLRELYPVDLNLRALFETPTPAGLSKVVEAVLWSAAAADPAPRAEMAAAAQELERGEL